MAIRRGDRGEDVKRVQKALQRFGFDVDDDGIFGRQTEAAVKEFQRRNGLDDDGAVGPKTLKALGLDDSDSGDVTEIDFTVEETEVPPIVQKQISGYVDRMEAQYSRLLDKSRDALDQFETTMAFATTKQANPDLLGALLSSVVGFATGQMIAKAGKVVPGLDFVGTVFDGVTGELERAGRASASASVGNWIKDQRVALDRMADRFDAKLLREEVSLEFLETDDKPTYFQALFEASQRLEGELLPSVSEFEAQLYEQWIDAHFDGLGANAPGCIEFRYEFDDNTFDFVSCTVQAESGDKVAGALNRLFAQGLLPSARRPIDMRVRKRACFRTDNFVPGGKSWFCGWLDADNNIISVPVKDEAETALREQVWRLHNRFS